MHFQIHKRTGLQAKLPHEIEFFTWSLEKADGPVCQSAVTFETEKEARSNIAQAKKSFRATSRSKVFSPGEGPE